MSPRTALRRTLAALACLALFFAPPPGARALDFEFTEGAGLAALRQTDPAQHAALWAGIRQGAADWAALIETDITVRVTVDAFPVSAGWIGLCGPSTVAVPYDELRGRLVSAADPRSLADAVAVANLPGATPDFFTGGSVATLDATRFHLTRANAKALGVVDARAAGSDAFIALNTIFSFDADRSDGVSGGTYDLGGLVAHELGHALGFVCCVDGFGGAGAGATINPFLVDLFRFSAPGVRDASSSLADKYFSLDGGQTDADGGAIDLVWSNGTPAGDQQAHHWKAGRGLGVMDPISVQGTVTTVGYNDALVLDALGYNLSRHGEGAGGGGGAVAPEPGALALALTASLLYLLRAGVNASVPPS